MSEQQLPAWADPSVSPAGAGPAGRVTTRAAAQRRPVRAAFAVGSLATPAAADSRRLGGDDPHLAYLVGDHHIHSVYSHDAKYTFSQLAPAERRVRPGLDGLQRALQLRARQLRRPVGAPGDPEGARREPASADLPGSGVVHTGRRARHGLRGARPARGGSAHQVRTRLRRQAAGLHGGLAHQPHGPPTRPTRSRPSSGSRSSAAPVTSTTCSSSPTTPTRRASTPRTRYGAGGTRRPRS